MAYNPEYYQQNKERIKANHKRHREKCKREGKPVQKYNPEYYQRNKERINATHKRYIEKRKQEENSVQIDNHTHKHTDKDAVRVKQKEYREQHKEQIRIKRLEHYQKCRERYDAYMLDKCCERCGTTDVRVLVWHHTNPLNKDTTVVRLITGKWERVLAEIAKCICVCHNCHHIIHNYE